MKTTRKTIVKKTTGKKKVVKESIIPVIKTEVVKVTENKVVKPVYTYKNVASETIKSDFGKYLRKQGKEVTERMTERGIKLSDVVKISKQVQHQLLYNKIRSIATKFYFTLKDGSIKIFNFSVFEKI